MLRNRIQAEEPMVRIPQLPAPLMSSCAFAACSPAAIPGLTAEQMQQMQLLYQYALQQAQESARPSLLDRDLLGVWN
jgi:hypothetical protein